MGVKVAFGKHGLDLDLPEGFNYQVLEARSAAPLADKSGALEEALDSPIGTAPLVELARGKQSAAISICDITRPTPNSTILPPMLRRLEQAGIARGEIKIMIATGLHRPATDDEVLQLVGEEIANSYRIINHKARIIEEQRHLGETKRGTPVYIDEQFMDADLHITAGFIEPHFMAGYSGGRKLIVPGQAGADTIRVLHSPRFMRDPRTYEGNIEGNPLHEEFLEITAMAGHDFMVDVALTRSREIAGIFAGDPIQAHRRGVEFVSQVMTEVLEEPVDAVITTGAGYPLDLTFYQCIKGASAARFIVKPGGKVLLVGACEEGAGAPEFGEMLKRYADADSYMNATAQAPVIIDQWQLDKLAQAVSSANLIYYVPGLPAEYHPTLWGRGYGKIGDALAALTEGLPAGARIAVVPEGPYVLAMTRDTATTTG